MKRLLSTALAFITLVGLASPASAEPTRTSIGTSAAKTIASAQRATNASARYAPVRGAKTASVDSSRTAASLTKKPVARTSSFARIARDWAKAPAIVEHEAKGAVLAVSDVHGHYEPTFRLLEKNGVLRGSVDKPGSVEWTGKHATLVVVGDVINKGGGSLELIDMFRSLQSSAEKGGGKVIVTMGNHEADFLHEPLSARSLRDGSDGRIGLGHEIRRAGGSARATAHGVDPEGRGQWLRELPFAARVGNNFFIHSGNTRGMSHGELKSTIEHAVTTGGFGHRELVSFGHDSVLGAADWRATAADAERNAQKLGVKRIIMGHVPGALDAHGQIAKTDDGALVKLDTGFGDGHAPPQLLRIGTSGTLHRIDADRELTKLGN